MMPTARPAHPGPVGGRRAFLGAAAAAALTPALLLSACAAPAGLPAAPGAGAGAGAGAKAGADPGAAASDYHFINRLSWGATDAELQRLRQRGRAAYIDEQLRAAAGPLPTAAQAQIDILRIQQRAPLDLAMEIEATRKAGDALPVEDARKAAREAYQQSLNRLARESAHRHLLRAVYAPNQLQAQLQWFWFNHFNVHQYKANIRVLLGDFEEQAIRPHVLGRFRDLLGAVTRHPAMLRYLDNEQNAAGRINENFARELLELHTLGVSTGDAVSGRAGDAAFSRDGDAAPGRIGDAPSGRISDAASGRTSDAAAGRGGGYTQRDVQELARVLTGHGVNFSDATPKLPPRLRPEQAAQYRRAGGYEFNPARHDFGDKTWLGRSIRGRGAAELDEVLDVLALHPATARFVSAKLARQLLCDDPPPALVEAMAQAWQRSGGDIAQVLAVLLNAPEFSAPPSSVQTAKFKDPMHFVVSAVRACHGERVVLNTAPMQSWLNRLGQGLYNRQTPDGYPSNAAAWSSSGQLATRLDIARVLGSGNAGLFKSDDASMPFGPSVSSVSSVPSVPREQPALPQLARPIYWQVVRPLLAAPTRDALDAAALPQDWNTLYLSSPEFMYC